MRSANPLVKVIEALLIEQYTIVPNNNIPPCTKVGEIEVSLRFRFEGFTTAERIKSSHALLEATVHDSNSRMF